MKIHSKLKLKHAKQEKWYRFHALHHEKALPNAKGRYYEKEPTLAFVKLNEVPRHGNLLGGKIRKMGCGMANGSGAA